MKRLCLLAFVTAAIAFRTANYASNNCPRDIEPGDVKLVPDPTDCHKYYVCYNGQEIPKVCDEDNRGVQMCFNGEICDKAEVVPCCKTSTVPPTQSTVPPTESTEPPTQSTVPPTQSTVPPTESTEPPTESTEPPTQSTEPPTESTVPPTESTEPPTESTEPTTESTVKPTTPSENKTSCAPNRLKSIEMKFWWLKAIFA